MTIGMYHNFGTPDLDIVSVQSIFLSEHIIWIFSTYNTWFKFTLLGTFTYIFKNIWFRNTSVYHILLDLNVAPIHSYHDFRTSGLNAELVCTVFYIKEAKILHLNGERLRTMFSGHLCLAYHSRLYRHINIPFPMISISHKNTFQPRPEPLKKMKPTEKKKPHIIMSQHSCKIEKNKIYL